MPETTYQEREPEEPEDDEEPPQFVQPLPFVPPEVKVALDFVAVSAQKFGMRFLEGPDWGGGDTTVEEKMHPAQEDTFYKACLRLGRYFDSDLKCVTVSHGEDDCA